MSPCEIPNFEALVSTLAEDHLNENNEEYVLNRCLVEETTCDMSLTRAHDDGCITLLPTSLTDSENAATWAGTLSETGPSSCTVESLMLCDSFSTQLSSCTSVAHVTSAETLGEKNQVPLHDYFSRGMSSPLATLLQGEESSKTKGNKTSKNYVKPPGFYNLTPLEQNPPTPTLTSSPQLSSKIPPSTKLPIDMNIEPRIEFPNSSLLVSTSSSVNVIDMDHHDGDGDDDDDDGGDGSDDDDDDISLLTKDEIHTGRVKDQIQVVEQEIFNEHLDLAIYDKESEKCLAVTDNDEHSYYDNVKHRDFLNVGVDINSTTSSCATRLPNPHLVPISERNKDYHQVFLKILATQLVSGTIIGKGGKGLNWFRRKSRVSEIKISMPWELYPKTEYRTLLFRGTVKAVLKATCIIADLMLTKYSVNLSQGRPYNPTDKMIVMVVLPSAFQAAMEDIKKTTDPSVLNITLFRDDGNCREIVAVLKGNRTKIKELVVAIASSMSETVDPANYCFVTYPNTTTLPFKRSTISNTAGISNGNGSVGVGGVAQSQSQPLRVHQQEENWRPKEYNHAQTYTGAPVSNICDNFNMNALDAKVRNHHVVIQTHLPPHLITRAIKLANIYKCNFQATNAVDIVSNGTSGLHALGNGGAAANNDMREDDDHIKCEISGPFGDCCTAASIIFSLI